MRFGIADEVRDLVVPKKRVSEDFWGSEPKARQIGLVVVILLEAYSSSCIVLDEAEICSRWPSKSGIAWVWLCKWKSLSYGNASDQDKPRRGG